MSLGSSRTGPTLSIPLPVAHHAVMPGGDGTSYLQSLQLQPGSLMLAGTFLHSSSGLEAAFHESSDRTTNWNLQNNQLDRIIASTELKFSVTRDSG